MKTVFRTTNPDVLAMWKQAELDNRDYQERREVLMKQFDPSGRRHYLTSNDGGWVGIEHLPDEPIPVGWRLYSRGAWYLVPKVSTKAGKAASNLMSKCQPPRLRKDLPGMPEIAFIGVHLLQPGVEFMAGAVYVVWGGDVTSQPIDTKVWEQVKLSEYYALVEAAEEATG